MTIEIQSSSMDTEPADVYAELKERRPDLFEPIPLVIGQTPEQAEGYPNGSVAGWRNMESPDFIRVEDNGEPLVNVDHLNPPIFTTGDYFAKLGNSGYDTPLDGAPLAQYVRKGVGDKLTKVQELLPDNCRLVVFDAWRSLPTQQATYEMCYQSLVDKLIDEGVLASGEELTLEAKDVISVETQKFISLPSPLPPEAGQSEADRERARQIPSPHNTGGSIDLGFVIIEGEYLEHLRELEAIASAEEDPYSIRKAEANFMIAMIYRNHSRLPDFGTAFDFAGAQSALAYCETNDSLGAEARDSRRILYNAMVGAGFEPYEEEWWHFNDGNQMAETTKHRRTGDKGVAKYGNADLSEAQQYHERIHRQLFELLAAVAENPVAAQNIPEDLKKHGATPELVLDLSAHIGNPKETRSFIPTHDMKYRGDIPPELVLAISRAQGR
mgnify:CR=1 FL=1